LAPSIYEPQIARNLRQTSDAEMFIIRNGSPPLGNIADIRGVLKRVEVDAALNPAELLQVAAVLRSVRGMKRYGGAERRDGASPDADGVSALIGALVDNQKLENNINHCILNDEELADDASPALLSIRRQIKRVQESIKDKLMSYLRSPTMQKYMQDSLVTMRGDRYVIPVKQEHRGEIKGLVHDMSASGATVFIEPMAVVEANNEIRELKVKESIEIEKILAELTMEVAQMRPELVVDIETLGLLDFLFAKAKLSLDYDCTKPVIGKDCRINIRQGRHPLLARDSVVPIDFWTAAGVNTIIITGPNTGGKTVALKTVGLLTLMAQAGLHIPAADGSTLRLYSQVFADIGDEQSIEQSLSTFSSHMRNIVHIVRRADEETLALFDEIGAGTDPVEGAAIATSILECLHQTG
jgi:DNA mismatch repair protein MutS2